MSRAIPVLMSAYKALKSIQSVRILHSLPSSVLSRNNYVAAIIHNNSPSGISTSNTIVSGRYFSSSSSTTEDEERGGGGGGGSGSGRHRLEELEESLMNPVESEQNADFRNMDDRIDIDMGETVAAAGGSRSIRSDKDKTECESITQRLRRLSQSRPEEFVPSADVRGDGLKKAKLRYRDTLNEYESRFEWNQRQRYRNPNFRPRREGLWGDTQYREFSSNSFREEKEIGISSVDEFEVDDARLIPDEKWSMIKLNKRVKELVDSNQVKEAVDTLIGALSVGGFHYNRNEFVYLYNLCISACAQVGYVQMAFKLFNDMKKRGFPPKPSTYTSLFNACANSSNWDAEKNIERMDHLRELMAEKGIQPNQVHYHAMIKGYGRCGDLQTSFAIVDEMISRGEFTPTTETFNFLLQACITDSLNGFRHVLVTWRKMQSLKIRPDIYSCNLLLRAVRECGIQIPQEGNKQQKSLPRNSQPNQNQQIGRTRSTQESILLLPAAITEEESNDMLNLICLNESDKALANIRQYDNSVTSGPKTYEDVIRALSLPENKLAVLGGLRGLFTQMSADKVGPNLKTLNEMAQIIHPTDVSDLILLLKSYKIKPNIDFFNLIIKRCHLKGCGAQARSVMRILPEYNVSPNIMTWGVSAIACKDWTTTITMLEEMDHANFTPNVEIMGAILHNAVKAFDPMFVLRVMEETKKRGVKPDAKFVLQIEEFRQKVKKGLVSQELGQEIHPTLARSLSNPNRFEYCWKKFLTRYDSYMRTTEVKETPKDPWAYEFQKFLKHRSHKPQADPDNADRYFKDRSESQHFVQQAKNS